ncbi:MAG: HAD family hydrolase [Alphaproteobacteria bacterium]|nr:HAD family hydrolase [Alphaproteobacteria bacterium]MCW5739287.1 HAD family hydrolase [Alphaproteobacteria bacterium]
MRALIFDFDGTILDTETPEFESWRLEYAVFGVEMPMDLWVQLIGSNTQGVFDPYAWLEGKIGRGLDRETLRVRRRAVMMDLIAAERPRPGIEDWMAGARRRDLGLAIASTSRRPWVEQHLSAMGLLEHFDHLATGDLVEHAKPAPDLYLLAAQKLGVAPHEAIAIEDSRNGVAAAKAAGMFTIAVPNAMTAGLDLSAADLRVDSLAALELGEAIRLASGRMSS